ncbi:DUF839 domain-containing protein [Parahaliea maris]|uniref:DUF839 domain-containing protein n=1 Tax=Parahaliea maris TaxID=2716870 RepID=A0A5C9A5E8_9GAMM|nr:alkaline phosphatase PhoX [Parahaliea maris]TXS96008.1 DUF839 domain-containing protein [Parahaliea maris]
MNHRKTALAAGLLAIASTYATAGTQPFFTPLTQSSAVATPDHVNEKNSPWQAPAGISQVNLTSMKEIEADAEQSVVRAPGLGTGASMWDMVAYDPTGEYIFIPHETSHGAGVSRYNIAEDFNEVLFHGDSTGVWNNGTQPTDFGAFDPARFTPYGTVILGEEWSGQGRVIEVLNPYANPADIEIVEKESFANTSQEGISFGVVNTNVVYYVDENHSGSIYKFVAQDEHFNNGATYVLDVKAFDGDPSKNWNQDENAGTVRTGKAHWRKISNTNGKLTNGVTQNPFDNVAPEGFEGEFRAGRIAADQAGATPFGRPEDTEIGTLANGNEVLYFTATSESAVYSVEMDPNNKNVATVRVFASESDTPKNVGFLPTTGVINSPDNLAQDGLGNIYIIEDAPNGGSVGGDIWFVRDADGDGVAESVDHFLSIQVDGAEATGMVFNPAKPTEFVAAVQHPDTTGSTDGTGDALWKFDISGVVPPTCEDGRYNEVSVNNEGAIFRTCTTDDAEFVSELENTAY